MSDNIVYNETDNQIVNAGNNNPVLYYKGVFRNLPNF